MKSEEIIKQIDMAFEHAAMPQTEEELTTFYDIDSQYTIKNFLCKSRNEIDSSSFQPSVHMEDFHYMKQSAVEYYLPPVLKLMLADPGDDVFWIFLYGFLHKDCFNEPSLKGYTSVQRIAIANWAKFLQSKWKSLPEYTWWSTEIYLEMAKEARKLVLRFTE